MLYPLSYEGATGREGQGYLAPAHGCTRASGSVPLCSVRRRHRWRASAQPDSTVLVSDRTDRSQRPRALVATSSLNDLTDGDVVAPQVDTRTALAR